MHQSGYECKLMKMYAIPEVSLLNNKNFVQNYCTSNEGNRPHAKKWCDTQNIGVQGRATETKISRVSILQRRVFYRKIRKIWIFADSWKFARRPAGTLESLGFSARDASLATRYRSSFSCSRCIDCVFSTPIPHWNQIEWKRIFDSIAASKLKALPGSDRKKRRRT